jgi:NTP pyrophosphatase (non-canonical NTP hydrolase)
MGKMKSQIDDLVFACHSQARDAGWWHDITTGKPVIDNPLAFSNKLMLTVSELSEAMEADRKGLMDDKLPHMDGRVVELADAIIRIFDLAGAYNMPLGKAFEEKLAYNANRHDHKKENRLGIGGKTY